MKQEEFVETIESQLEFCKDLLFMKNGDYNEGEDKLHNFKAAAVMQGVTTEKALAGMMAKHTMSIFDMCSSDEDYSMRVWDEKITDHINYLLLLKAVVVDSKTRLDEMRGEPGDGLPQPVSAHEVALSYEEATPIDTQR